MSTRRAEVIVEGRKMPWGSSEPIRSSAGTVWTALFEEHYVALRDYRAEFVSWPETQIALFVNGKLEVEYRTGQTAHRHAVTPGRVSIWPSGYHMHDVSAEGRCHALLLEMSRQSLERLVPEEDSRSTSIVPQHAIVDPDVDFLLRRIAHEVRCGFPAGALYGDQLCLALYACILGKYACRRRCQPRVAGQLSSAQLRRIQEYIQANLDKNFCLTDLAAVVGLSPRHMARLFRNSTGMTPHQFVTKQRIDVAKGLLARADLRLRDVAWNVGFQNQSHFSKVFRRFAGMSPRMYRQESGAPRRRPRRYMRPGRLDARHER